MKIEDLLNKKVQINGENYIYEGIVSYQFFNIKTYQHTFCSENGKPLFYKKSTLFIIEEADGKIFIKINTNENKASE